MSSELQCPLCASGPRTFRFWLTIISASYAQAHKTAASEVTPEAMEALVAHRWPGNIRELKNVVERVVLKTAGRPVRYADLPSDVVQAITTASSPAAGTKAEILKASFADEMARQMLKGGESFWSAVYPTFIARDMTRGDLRKIVQIGLESTNGNYRLLVQLFNMPNEDYKRFLSFLRKHDCHLPFQRFRAAPTRLQTPSPVRSFAKV